MSEKRKVVEPESTTSDIKLQAVLERAIVNYIHKHNGINTARFIVMHNDTADKLANDIISEYLPKTQLDIDLLECSTVLFKDYMLIRSEDIAENVLVVLGSDNVSHFVISELQKEIANLKRRSIND